MHIFKIIYRLYIYAYDGLAIEISKTFYQTYLYVNKLLSGCMTRRRNRIYSIEYIYIYVHAFVYIIRVCLVVVMFFFCYFRFDSFHFIQSVCWESNVHNLIQIHAAAASRLTASPFRVYTHFIKFNKFLIKNYNLAGNLCIPCFKP